MTLRTLKVLVLLGVFQTVDELTDVLHCFFPYGEEALIFNNAFCVVAGKEPVNRKNISRCAEQ